MAPDKRHFARIQRNRSSPFSNWSTNTPSIGGMEAKRASATLEERLGFARRARICLLGHHSRPPGMSKRRRKRPGSFLYGGGEHVSRIPLGVSAIRGGLQPMPINTGLQEPRQSLLTNVVPTLPNRPPFRRRPEVRCWSDRFVSGPLSGFPGRRCTGAGGLLESEHCEQVDSTDNPGRSSCPQQRRLPRQQRGPPLR